MTAPVLSVPLDRDAPRRGFVTVDGRLIHYRSKGSGPALVLLHDSPRSSRLHLDTIEKLADRYCVHALDTPGYGLSDPLDVGRPTIAHFAEALARTLEVMGLGEAVLYATHTSAKIALECAARYSRPSRLILDGLSIPVGPPDEDFIAAYMRPFRLDDAGGYLATEWTRMRDMLRWFPWFRPSPETRMRIARQSEAWMADYVVDFFSAGPHYSSAYAAAMRYDPTPALRTVTCPTVVAARSDDVLYASLDRVPVDENDALTVMRLAPDREAWFDWLAETAAGAPTLPPPPVSSGAASYVDLPHGQMLVRRAGPGEGRPLLILDAPTTHHALRWQKALQDRPTFVPDLPGYGESDPLPDPTVESIADALGAMIAALGHDEVDVLASGFATPLAAALAARHGSRIRHVVLDGCFAIDGTADAGWVEALCPPIEFDPAGGHLHRIWHMLRDGQAQWPWFDASPDAHRALPPSLSAEDLHPALVALLKQPVRYGDVVRAGVRRVSEAGYPAFDHATLIFEQPADAGYRAAQSVAAMLPAARTALRSADMAEAVAAVRTYLDDRPEALPSVAHERAEAL
jgi:pimeloyl-ACP methyl ester carboxylesterase